MFYRQCNLRKNNVETTSWLPEQYARCGKWVKLKEEDGWLITNVSKKRIEEKELMERRRDFKNQRKASDI